MWVSPFRNPRVAGYVLLSAAYRSLSRLSSALSAKASALRSSLLNLAFPVHSVVRPGFPLILCFLFFLDIPAVSSLRQATSDVFL